MDIDELKRRLAEPTSAPAEWQHVLELWNLLEYLKAQGVAATALRRFYDAEVVRMTKAQNGNASVHPAEIQFRGGIAGGVMWLVDIGWTKEDARRFVSDTAETPYSDVRVWHQQAARQEVPSGNFKLSLRWAAEQMVNRLRQNHNQFGTEELIKGVFSPIK